MKKKLYAFDNEQNLQCDVIKCDNYDVMNEQANHAIHIRNNESQHNKQHNQQRNPFQQPSSDLRILTHNQSIHSAGKSAHIHTTHSRTTHNDTQQPNSHPHVSEYTNERLRLPLSLSLLRSSCVVWPPFAALAHLSHFTYAAKYARAFGRRPQIRGRIVVAFFCWCVFFPPRTQRCCS